ncbi:MAG: cobalamin-dependent protein [Spirochaetales bacterium]|nr:cobalamin-dependent protein [Spirochaetales bacterium]
MASPRALLINPPVYDFALFDLFLKPYGLLRIGRWLEDGGYSVDLVNALDYRDPESASLPGFPHRQKNGTGKFFRQRLRNPVLAKVTDRSYARYGILPEVFKKRIKRINPDIVLVTSGMTYWYPGVVEAVEVVRESHPGVPVIVGGVYSTLLPSHCLKVTGADYIVSGEAELHLPAILKKHGLPVPPGTPGRDLLMVPELLSDAAVIRLNDGCPLRCDYCASHIICPAFKKGDAEEAFRVVRELHEKLGTRNFAFYDDALLASGDRVLIPFLEQLIDAAFDIRFFVPNALHLSLLHEKTAFLMKESGFQEIRLGFESSDDDFHIQHDRKYRQDDFPRVIKFLKRAGFAPKEIGVYILAGLPGQRIEEVEASVRYASSFAVKVCLARYSPVPGTSLWQQAVNSCDLPLEEEPLFHNNTLFPLNWSGFRRKDLHELKELVRKLNLKMG